jgi:hypothetical protein
MRADDDRSLAGCVRWAMARRWRRSWNDKQLTQGLEAARSACRNWAMCGLDHLISALNSPSTYLRHQAAQISSASTIRRSAGSRSTLRTLCIQPQRREQLHADLGARDTDELVAMWHEHDRSEWSEQAFEAMESTHRALGKLPVRMLTRDDRGSDIDENADPRIQELWLDGDIERLTDILEAIRMFACVGSRRVRWLTWVMKPP